MRIKNAKLEWYVLNYDWNAKKIINFNIFGASFIEKLYKEVKKKKVANTEDLKQFIDNWAKYYFSSRREYEIAVGDLGTKEEDLEKIDVYRQIKPNLDRITEYVNRELKIFLKEESDVK